MQSLSRILFFIFLFAISCGFAAAQNTKTLSHDKFSFEYPADWKLTDKSTGKTDQYNLTPPDGNVLIMVISYSVKVPDDDVFSQVKRQTAELLADKLYAKFNETGKAKREDTCITLENLSIPGNRITGFYNGKPSTADIFYVSFNQKFLNLIYLRNDEDQPKSAAAWDKLLTSFSYKKLSDEKPDFILDRGSDVVINGRATKLVKPIYPSGYKLYRNSIEVRIRVVIDETGKVIMAKNTSGSRERLEAAAENAAKESTFAPTIICGKPSKISGIIVYIFTR